MIGILNNLFEKIRRRSKTECGMTLIEVVIAFFLIAVISTVLIRGTITAVNTVRINKSKTQALAIANEKIEILKSLEYQDILITEIDEEWIQEYPALSEDIYSVVYQVTWVNDDESGYKQLKVAVSGEYLDIPIEIVTQIYPPVGEEATGVNIYPPPEELIVESDEGEGALREIILRWTAPETERTILRYNVYRDGIILGSTLTEYYQNSPGDDDIYSYSVTALYDGDIESVHSNSITTGTPFPYPPPQNFIITGYTLGGPNRTVHLQWEVPDTQLIIVEYMIYRDDIYIGSTIELIFENIIGVANYTFYAKTLYEDYNESGQSNTQTTQ